MSTAASLQFVLDTTAPTALDDGAITQQDTAIAIDVLSRVDVRAPRKGIVQAIKVHAVGAVVKPGETIALLAIQGEVRRIGVNVNQIARALNTAVVEGKVLDLESAYLDALRTELRAHMFTLREAFEGNLAYWAVEP